MKKVEAVNKRNEKEFVLTFLEDGKVLSLDIASGKEKEISMKTVKRWFVVGKEVENDEMTIFDQVEAPVVEEIKAPVVEEIKAPVVEEAEIEVATADVKKEYVYEYLYRGFSLGCQPNGFISHDDSFGRFGSVTYDRQLTAAEIESYELKEIQEQPEIQVIPSKPESKERKHSRTAIKKDGTQREDKFRPKLTEEKAYEILVAFHTGSKKSHIAKDFEVSFRTVTCIIEGLMWKDVYSKFHNQLKGAI